MPLKQGQITDTLDMSHTPTPEPSTSAEDLHWEHEATLAHAFAEYMTHRLAKLLRQPGARVVATLHVTATSAPADDEPF